MFLGNFHAGCAHMTRADKKHIRLFKNLNFSWLIGDKVDTTITEEKSCAYDRCVEKHTATPVDRDQIRTTLRLCVLGSSYMENPSWRHSVRTQPKSSKSTRSSKSPEARSVMSSSYLNQTVKTQPQPKLAVISTPPPRVQARNKQHVSASVSTESLLCRLSGAVNQWPLPHWGDAEELRPPPSAHDPPDAHQRLCDPLLFPACSVIVCSCLVMETLLLTCTNVTIAFHKPDKLLKCNTGLFTSHISWSL